MSILSTSLYGSSTSGNRISGMASGLDTDTLVEQMAAGTKNKINRAYQAKQKLLYKQEAYRSISSKLVSFSDKYLSYSSSSNTNILSSKFFKSYSVKSSSDYVSVMGNEGNIKDFKITDVSSAATRASYTPNISISNRTFGSSTITDKTSSLAGETITLEYEGKNYSLTLDKDFGKGALDVTVQDVAKELNEQIAKISELSDKIKYDESSGLSKLTFEVDKTAKLTTGSAKILDVLNLKTGQVAQSQTDITESLTVTKEEIFINKDAYMTFDYNGVSKTISFSKMVDINTSNPGTYTYDADGVSEFLQDEIDNAYGAGKVTVGLNTTNDGFNFTAVGETDIIGVSGISKELGNFTGIEPAIYNRLNKNCAVSKTNFSTNLVTGTVTINGEQKNGYSISVNGKEFTFDETATLKDIINKINDDNDAGVTIYYSSVTDKITVKSDETGSNSDVVIKDVTGGLAESLFGSGDINADNGKDTIMTYTLNGVETTVSRSTLNFTIDEINVNLDERAVGSIVSSDLSTSATFVVTKNTDDIVKNVKQFIDDYNEIISLINEKVSERPDSDYKPLTPDQLDEMEKDDIDSWTEQAKKGMLYGDSKISNVLRNLRNAMSNQTSVSSLTLSSVGIAAASFDTSGKLNFDEEVFKTKLNENPEEVINLFSKSSTETNGVSGIAKQIQSILQANVGTSGGKGILIEEAGLDNGRTADTNYLSKRMEEYDDKMAELKDDLADEKERYYKKFTALETALNSLNSQSSWLTSMLGQ